MRRTEPAVLDQTDRQIINRLQGDFPICEAPFAAAAAEIGIGEAEMVERVRSLRERGVLSRFGPMYHAEKMGGALCLAALAVPAERFDAVAEMVNALPEIAHNYARDHDWNMWFVIATERPERVAEVVAEIEALTGLPVLAVPKLEEFYVGLHFEA